MKNRRYCQRCPRAHPIYWHGQWVCGCCIAELKREAAIADRRRLAAIEASKRPEARKKAYRVCVDAGLTID